MKVLQLSDTHLGSDPTQALYGFDVRTRYQRVLAHLRAAAPRPELVLVTGDISQDEGPAVYGPFSNDLESLGTPTLVIPGNHDVPDAFVHAFDGDWPVAWRFEHEAGGWRFLCLNTQVPGAVEGGLGREQIERLDRALGENTDAPTALLLHHPLVPVGTPWLDAHRVAEADDLRQRLRQHPQVRLLLCGHVHHATDVEVHPGLRQLTAPAIAAPFRAGSTELATEDAPPGLRWLELEPDGGFTTRVEYLD